ncbi:hypothetical protein DMENIID0001_151730 [Sergentomyia squamirostris]
MFPNHISIAFGIESFNRRNTISHWSHSFAAWTTVETTVGRGMGDVCGAAQCVCLFVLLVGGHTSNIPTSSLS